MDEAGDLIQESATDKNFDYWLNRPFVGEELRRELKNATLLIVPAEGVRERSDLNFPNGTEGLLTYLKDNARDGVVPDICIEDKDFKALALHDATIIVGTFVVTAIVAPIAVNLISKYLEREIGLDKAEETKVKFKMTVVESDGTSKKLSYDGPAKTFEKTIGERLKVPKPSAESKKLPGKPKNDSK